MSMSTAIAAITETITNQVLLTEGVIIGDIPDTYYNLEGLNSDQLMEVIE